MVDSNSTTKILVIEDDVVISTAIAERLAFEGWDGKVVSDGSVAVETAREFDPDLILLDLMLPGMNGFQICPQIRQFSRVPIIVVTARDFEEDEVKILGLGADDFISKPIRPSVLVAHIKVWLSRYKKILDIERLESPQVYDIRGLHIDIEKHQVIRTDKEGNQHEIILTPMEFALLAKLASAPEKVFSRSYLLKELWNWANGAGGTRTVDSHVKSLRRKITQRSEGGELLPDPIKTVHGVGYSLDIEAC
ncbi:MAG: response regulator transcription factor [Candidatus Ancillula sp.]|jgi:DNA-binding response OmpR family regulator|nr:response regulator transcription factor [Candidatus Ancillula sp.]